MHQDKGAPLQPGERRRSRRSFRSSKRSLRGLLVPSLLRGTFQGVCLASPIPGHALAHPFPTAKPSAKPGTVVLRCQWPYVAVPLPPHQEVPKQPGLGPTPPVLG